ncbi:MAG: aminotransferase class I/II-fold pyridoxal phosphate-dependent enzyme [Firmicutes bacterium]|nr:aminotransferase class I/II-fold pyridoxal phosphate-dependent enzyme [Bacillota bacterium]
MNVFLNNSSNGKKMVDKVFKAAVAAKEAKAIHGDIVVDATLGTLFDEDGKFVALESVWTPYEEISKVSKAKYASSIQGNPDFRKAVYNWLFGDLNEIVDCEIIATPGGAGAISSTIKNVLNPGETILKPSQGWGPYKTMAHEFGVTLTDYNMFVDGHFDLIDFQNSLSKVMKDQGKVLVIINDPCHNPTGYTLKPEEWDQILAFINELSAYGPVIILNDIAYIDYSNQGSSWKQHFLKYNHLNENVMVVIAFSCSKTLTAYGARVGAQVIISKNKEQLSDFLDASIYSARSIWSTVNNSAMDLFTKIMSDDKLLQSYLTEKQYYVDLLRDRAQIFVSECAEVGLEIYPFKEGFFVTIKVQNNQEKEALNLTLQQNNIFTVEVDGGLRIAICSVPKRKLVGLAKRIKELM